jgi:hypothetical protein
LAPLLDQTTERFNSIWERGDEALIKSQANDLLASIRFTMGVFGADAFRKWNGRSFEKSLNRTVFDAMVLFFDKEQTRTSSRVKSPRSNGLFRACVILIQNLGLPSKVPPNQSMLFTPDFRTGVINCRR